ncbi:carbohydrate ABC transporter permease [Citreimonas salinaria]|uniref:Carbohydrate ABC transporter membrane protein 1, CUT1 family n=1 Tax=Citreimonas salinaria TaxID=321339 RepID=A0A1H3MKI6_9RHOB|nr:sugar ABC transporter permease [Citreimonas salinaria]SDY77197.1 carbohydrate ABC transporter membrane protein 1, CUT1 family [Citreimonas salinaria]
MTEIVEQAIGRSRTARRRRKTGGITHIAVFLAPTVLIYSIFSIYPLIESLRLSLFDGQPDGSAVWIGLGNYATLLFDANWAVRFWNALWNNLILFFIHMIVQNPLGLLLAALLSLAPRFGGTYRTLIFVPTLLSVVIVGFVWELILSPLWGVAEGMMSAVGLGWLYAPWLGLEDSALTAVSLISVWQYVGIPMMLIYAALLSIPDELLDAARVDGLSGFAIFWKIKLPLILPTLGIVAILTYIGNFTSAFDLIYSIQGVLGPPDYSTDIMGTLMFRTFFGQQTQIGDIHMGATVASMMFFIILIGVTIYLLGVQRRLTRYEM